MTLTERNKQIVRDYVVAFNRGDFDALRQIFKSDAEIQGVLGKGAIDVAIPLWQELRAAFAIELTIEEMVAEGDTVAVRYTERGTFCGPFRESLPTGLGFELVAMEWFVVRDGRICRRWAARDSASQARQINLQLGQDRWAAVDHYINQIVIPPDPALEAALEASAAARLPAISVTPPQGKFLHLLARAQQARNILEIGTLGAYSTIWLARALPAGGKLITLEVDERHAQVARANLTRAGLNDVVELRLGLALDALPKLEAERRGPFDFIFIDADKPNTAEYFQWAVRLSRRGTVIVVDNVVRGGKVADANTSDPNVRGIRRFNEVLAREPRVTASELQTVCSKGYDGFALVLVTGEP